MKRLIGYMKLKPAESILAPLFKMLEASFELMIPLVIKTLVDEGIGGGSQSVVIRSVLIMVALGLIGLISSVTAQYFSAKAATGVATGVRHSLFEHLQKLSFSNMDQLGSSTMITRMTSDVNLVQTGVNMTLRLFLRSPFVVFGAMVMAFTVDVRSALIFAAVILALSLVVFGVMAVNIPMMKGVQKSLDKVLGATRENLSGVRVIRAFCKEDSQYAEFVEKNRDLAHRQKRAGWISGLTNPVTYLLINLAIAYLIYTGAVQVSIGILTPGEVVALYNYMGQILVELVKLANLIVLLTRAYASLGRCAAVLDTETSMTYPEKAALADSADEAVRFDGVSLTYKGAGDESITGVSFCARRGQTIGVIGGTGSGKSTLVNLIPRFYDATKGTVFLMGRPVADWPHEELRDRVAVVPQRAQLFKGTIRSNLLYGLASQAPLPEGGGSAGAGGSVPRTMENVTDEFLWQCLETAQAAEFVRQKPGGLDEAVEQGGRNLSGGQKQRLTIARALVSEPEILILDDSASALDYATDAALRQALKQLPAGTTTFIVSQRTSSIRHADQIIVMDDGEMVGCGTHDQLMDSCEVYREIHESQFRKEDGKGVQA